MKKKKNSNKPLMLINMAYTYMENCFSHMASQFCGLQHKQKGLVGETEVRPIFIFDLYTPCSVSVKCGWLNVCLIGLKNVWKRMALL